MKLTLVNGYQGRQILLNFRDAIFQKDTLLETNAFKLNYLQTNDKTYYDLRNTANAKVIELVENLCSLGIEKLDKLHSLVQSQPISIRAFLADRFSHAEECLYKLGSKFLSGVHSEDQCLHYGLVDLWNTRIRNGHWK
jgi:hypothetical protein